MSDQFSPVLSLLGDKTTPRLQKALTAYALGTMAWKAGRQIYNRIQIELTYTVVVNSDDAVYGDVHTALLNLLPDNKRRALLAQTKRHIPDTEETSYALNGKPSNRLVLSYDGNRTQTVTINGHKVTVSLDKAERKKSLQRSPDSITFTAKGASARDSIIKFLERITAERDKLSKAPKFHTATQWGSWIQREDLPLRNIDTIALREGQMERIVGDIEEFLNQEVAYNRLGIPYHHGILLTGPPGTGKTSIAKGLAKHFNADLYFIALADMNADTNLMDLFSAVDAGSFLLLEDIDTLGAAADREDSEDADSGPGLSLSGLLNALDGVATPHGVIVIMSTNHPEALDPALVRPGRVDTREEIGFMDDYQMEHIWDLAYNTTVGLPAVPEEVTPAAVIDVVKRNLNSEPEALTELESLFKES